MGMWKKWLEIQEIDPIRLRMYERWDRLQGVAEPRKEEFSESHARFPFCCQELCGIGNVQQCYFFQENRKV